MMVTYEHLEKILSEKLCLLDLVSVKHLVVKLSEIQQITFQFLIETTRLHQTKIQESSVGT